MNLWLSTVISYWVCLTAADAMGEGEKRIDLCARGKENTCLVCRNEEFQEPLLHFPSVPNVVPGHNKI